MGECMGEFNSFVKKGEIENNLSVDGIHLQESSKCITANNLIHNFNHFLEFVNSLTWYL